MQVTALNFGATPIDETITLPDVQPGPVVDMINETIEGDLSDGGELRITLDGYEGKSLRHQRRAASQRVTLSGAHFPRVPSAICPHPADDDASLARLRREQHRIENFLNPGSSTSANCSGIVCRCLQRQTPAPVLNYDDLYSTPLLKWRNLKYLTSIPSSKTCR